MESTRTLGVSWSDLLSSPSVISVFQSETKLPHLLKPECYTSRAAYDLEMEKIFATAWQFVGTVAELSNHGDFLTCMVSDTPVQVRNFNGEIRALSNVCAHRHALICSDPCGNSAKMRCQYHGWEYQADGSTGRIPQPKNFVPFDREETRLSSFQVASVGQLIFVNVSACPLPIEQYFGQDLFDLLSIRFGSNWSLALKWQPEYPANWKVPIENSLEAYHVPEVHPSTFREDPGAERSEHVLNEHRTAMGTTLPFSPHTKLDAVFQRAESRFVRWLGLTPTGSYWQHHVFPNLLFSFTDAISLVNCVIPQGPLECRAIVRQFGRMPEKGGAVKRLGARAWSRLTAAITKKILLEDLEIFSAIQTGLVHSTKPGVLGICEERIHRFQAYVQSKTATL